MILQISSLMKYVMDFIHRVRAGIMMNACIHNRHHCRV